MFWGVAAVQMNCCAQRADQQVTMSLQMLFSPLGKSCRKAYIFKIKQVVKVI